MKKSIWRTIKELFFGGPDYNSTRFSFDDAGPYFYLVKKHYCEKCNGLLKRRTKSTIETNLDYSTLLDGQMSGPTKLIKYFFYCTHCKLKFSAKELKAIERSRKKR